MKCTNCGAKFKGNFCPKCSAPAPETPKKKRKWLPIVLGVLAVIIVIGAIGGSDDKKPPVDVDTPADMAAVSNTDFEPTTPLLEEPTAPKEKPKVEEPAPLAEPATISVDIELTSGHYTAGIDFPAGKYDLTAVSGGGNVSSSNAYTGGLNAIMGIEAKNTEIGTDMYEQEYANIKLDDGVVLSLAGVTLKITCADASGNALTPRNQTIADPVELGNGNFVAGVDFPAGVYDLEVVSGGGNVSSSNAYDGGINAIMGTAEKNTAIGTDMYEQSFKNLQLDDAVTLTISGVQLRLTPSK